MLSRLAWPTLLAIGALMIGGFGCWSPSSSTRAVGTGGAGWSAAGRSGGLAGAGGVAGSAGGTDASGVAGGAGSTGLAGAGGAASAGLAGAGGGSAGLAGAGSAGSAGRAGAGGVAASGGGAGSFVADGGVPVDAAVTCDDLHNQYAANLLVARRCTVDAGGQCTQLVASTFPQVMCGPTGGQTYVNDASALAPNWSEVFALNCVIAVKCGGGSSYSAIPDGGVCVATDGGTGLCALLLPYATYP